MIRTVDSLSPEDCTVADLIERADPIEKARVHYTQMLNEAKAETAWFDAMNKWAMQGLQPGTFTAFKTGYLAALEMK